MGGAPAEMPEVATAPGQAAEPVSSLRSLPLLKFEGERPLLCEDGLKAIAALPGPVCPIAFVGDGRSGKSFLASKVVGVDNAFETDDSDVAVTEGIDVAIITSHPGHMVIFDCEGGNN